MLLNLDDHVYEYPRGPIETDREEISEANAPTTPRAGEIRRERKGGAVEDFPSTFLERYSPVDIVRSLAHK